MQQQCQEKNDMQVEKVATIFSFARRECASRSQLVKGSQGCEHQTRDQIVPAVRENSRTQAAPKKSEQAEHRSEYREHDHVAQALISMRQAKHQCGDRYAHSGRAPRPRGELALQIAAKYGLFRDAGQNAQPDPRQNLWSIRRRQLGEVCRVCCCAASGASCLPGVKSG